MKNITTILLLVIASQLVFSQEKQGKETVYEMPGSSSTPFEQEIYEQFVMLKKYGENWKDLGYLLNKVNPVGGRFNLKTPEGLKAFYKEAEKVTQKYNLPTTFK